MWHREVGHVGLVVGHQQQHPTTLRDSKTENGKYHNTFSSPPTLVLHGEEQPTRKQKLQILIIIECGEVQVMAWLDLPGYACSFLFSIEKWVSFCAFS